VLTSTRLIAGQSGGASGEEKKATVRTQSRLIGLKSPVEIGTQELAAESRTRSRSHKADLVFVPEIQPAVRDEVDVRPILADCGEACDRRRLAVLSSGDVGEIVRIGCCLAGVIFVELRQGDCGYRRIVCEGLVGDKEGAGSVGGCVKKFGRGVGIRF